MKTFLLAVLLSAACGGAHVPSMPDAQTEGTGDPYWCYRGYNKDNPAPVMEGEPPPCPPQPDAGNPPGN